MDLEYGYIRWRSTLTGKEGGGNVPVANPSNEVALKNAQYPELEHWSVPVAVCLPPPMVEIDDA
jgi:hypothetical protein